MRPHPTPKSQEPADIAPPSRWLLAFEYRALFEFAAGLSAYKSIQNLVPKGDGHPILVLPGLGVSDFSTQLLRNFLQELGYVALPWGLGINTGMIEGKSQRVHQRIKALSKQYGRSVSLIGQSLGGVYARELAKLEPSLIRQVITLGSPFSGHPQATNATRVYEWLSGDRIDDMDPSLVRDLQHKPPVPTSSIFSKTDGVVSWRCSLEREAPDAESIHLHGVSHLGMAASPAALYLVAHRLAEPEGAWQPFAPQGWQKMLYSVGHWRADDQATTPSRTAKAVRSALA